MKKKVLIISLDYYPGEVGGAEVAIKNITDRIDSSDYEFHLITLRYDTTMAKVEQIDNVLVHRIGFGFKSPTIADRKKFPLHYNKHLFQFTAAWKARQLHKKHQYDGVWAMMAHSCGVPAALFKGWFPDVKFILTLQEGDPPEHIERLARPVWRYFKRAFTTSDRMQVLSSFLGRWAKRMGHPHEPVLIPNAVNTAHFTQSVSDADIENVRAEFDVSKDDTLIITTSRLVLKNGIDSVIEAMPLLPESVKFIVFGDGPERETYQQLAERLEVSDRVQFRGLIGHDVMPTYLKACDIFTRPSRSEGMGNSFIEAMAAELPVIATQEGGIADFLFDETRNPDKPTTGWAVDAGSGEQIANAVKDILARPEKVSEVTSTAKAMVLEQYDWELIAKRMKTEVFDLVLQ